MNETIKAFRKSEKLFTDNPRMTYLIEKGRVTLFIVHMREEEGGTVVPERQFRLADLGEDAEIPIPSFAYRDRQGRLWRFAIQAEEDDTVLKLQDNAVTRRLLQKFLQYVNIDTYEQEGGAEHGFENSLVSFFDSHSAQATSVILRSEAEEGINREKAYREIAGGVTSGSYASSADSGLLYRVLDFGAKKCGIQTVAQEDQVRAAIGRDAEITIPEIARISHFICREITLDIDWYQGDCGVLICTLDVPLAEPADGAEKKGDPGVEKRPVACFPKGGGYYFYDAKVGRTQKLTAKIAERLEPKAYSIRRALPRTALGRKEITSFVKKSVSARDIVWLLGVSIVSTLIGVLLPKLNQMIYDDYIPLGDFHLLVQVCLVIASCMIGNVFISIVKRLLEFRIPCRTGYELQDAMYQRLFELPESFFRRYDSADLAQRVMRVGSLANTIVSKIVVNGFSLIVSLIYFVQMFHYSWKLALAGIAMLVVYGAILFACSLPTLRCEREAAEMHGQAAGKLYQFISGIDKIRMAGAEERTILEYTTPVVQEKRLSIRSGRISALVSNLIDAGPTIFSMVLYFMMIKTKINVTMGEFMAFNTAFGSLTSAIMSFVQAGVDYTQLKPEIERLKPFVGCAPENDQDKEAISELKGAISVQNVTFAYDKAQGNILNDLSLEVKEGEYVAIVGPSGCGKSTLLKLLLGFEKPDVGAVKYDGKDISSVDKHALRKHLGVVLQNGRLTAGSIYENIAIAAAKPDIKKVWQVLDDVGMKQDVEEMPMGIHTMLSEAGNTISGGQQQRILIARAIYNDPAVLFFDEATSALDNITQAKVCASLDQRHMTRIVIAHRLSTVRNCDRIIVLDGGKVAEEGNFESLMALKGRFYEMASRQLV